MYISSDEATAEGQAGSDWQTQLENLSCETFDI